jgi:hypothetical protein
MAFFLVYVIIIMTFCLPFQFKGMYYDKDIIETLDSVWDMQCKRHIFASLGSEEALPPPQKMLPVCRKIRKMYFGTKRITFEANKELTKVSLIYGQLQRIVSLFSPFFMTLESLRTLFFNHRTVHSSCFVY